jgi:hypothetical protein
VSGFREEGFISTWQLQAIVSFLIKKEGLGADLIYCQRDFTKHDITRKTEVVQKARVYGVFQLVVTLRAIQIRFLISMVSTTT